jgi:hypothetical protein
MSASSNISASPASESVRQSAYRDAASAMCFTCALGQDPKWMIVFQGWTHVWKVGNGHSKCTAGPIWEKLIMPLARTHEQAAKMATEESAK